MAETGAAGAQATGQGGASSPFLFFQRFGRARQPAAAPASPQVPVPVAPVSALPKPAAPLPAPAALPEEARAVLDAAAEIAARIHWMTATAAEGAIEAGLFVTGGELHAWAVDRRDPLRPVALGLIVDGMVAFEGFTEPAGDGLALATGCRLDGHRTLELTVDAEARPGPAFAAGMAWLDGAARAELGEFLSRLARTYRQKALQRRVQQDIDGTLRRLARASDGDEAEARLASPFLRHLAHTARLPLRGAGPFALANWIIAEVLEDPARREVFCLDAAAEAVLNQPALNPAVFDGDMSLALLCFWRRHYQSLDIFTDEGLRRLQYKFATAPFIRIKNNHRLLPPALRTRLAEPAATTAGQDGGLPWSWYWSFMHQDQGNAEKLRDGRHARIVSFKEVVGDTLDPGRLSFNPEYWAAHWGAWGADAGAAYGHPAAALSRFDLVLVALLANTDRPEAVVAEQGAEIWRRRLLEAWYRAMPELAPLSLLCADAVPAPVPEELPRRELAIVGYANGTGLARNMAMFAEALAPLRPLLVDARSGRCTNAPDDGDVRANVVLLCVNAEQAPEVLGRCAALCSDAHVIGFFLWETDRPPQTHLLGARVVDEIWTPSSYVADAYRPVTDVPVVLVGKGLRAPDPRRWHPFVPRFRRGQAFTFLYVAEFASSIVRKNPLDAVRAFRMAFDRTNQSVRLVLKLRSIDRAHWSNIDGYWEELEELASGDRRIEFVTGELPEDDYWALLGAADAVLSLHRGEGFCYPVADAMLLGRPVIVSDYSGTRDFCDDDTAFLVDVDVIAAPPAHLRCASDIGNWSVPRLDSAVAAMRQAVASRAEAARRAAAGQARVAAQYDFEAWRDRLLARLAPRLARPVAPARGRLMLSSLAPAGQAD